MSIDKLVVTHHGALTRKYGTAGVQRITKALRTLITADKRRGLITAVVQLDVAADMTGAGQAVGAVADAKACKQAIDRLCKAHDPHYVMLLGGPDVVPMVPVRNPAWSEKDGDGDQVVPTDLPYACDTAYSTNPNRFLGPTRVVGRLPDIIGSTDSSLLAQLITAAARAEPRAPEYYQSGFSITAQAWQASTELSLKNILGTTDALHSVPPEGPAWSKGQLSARVHFINCHGADASSQYFGQPPGVEEFPVAHDAKRLRDRVSAGTVVAAECCYGAQLYDPKDAGGQHGIALAYLLDGASAFFGSSTIAYGPSEGNASADLICQFFLQQVLSGASTGRAALEARQKFAGARTHLDPYDLKTLMQFYLLGDPSLHPVSTSGHALTRTAAFKKAFSKTRDRSVRGLRREKLIREGSHLAKAMPTLEPIDTAPSTSVAKTLAAMAKETGLPPSQQTRMSFALQPTAKTKPSTRQVHVIKGPVPQGTNAAGVVRIVAIVATEDDGELLHVRRLHAR